MKAAAIHQEKLDAGKIGLVDYLSLFLGFSQALLIYITSSYFKEASGTDDIGIYYILAYGTVLLVLFNLHKLIKRWGKSYTFLLNFLLKLITLGVLMFLPPSGWGIFLLILYIILSVLEIVFLDIILESFSTDRMSGRVRGLYLAIMNVGFIVGPFVSARILGTSGFHLIFVISFLLNALIFVVTFLKLGRVNHKFSKQLTVGKLLGKVWKKKSVLRIYYISFALEAFYAVMTIFSPLYLRSLGISWGDIGFIFSIMLIPFVIMPYPVGYLADTKLKERGMIIFFLLLMGTSTALVAFVDSAAAWLWASLFLVTRVGAASLQTLRDSYFYKKIDGRDVDLIDFFRTALPVANIVIMAASILILLFFPMNYLFIFLSALVLSALVPAVRLGAK